MKELQGQSRPIEKYHCGYNRLQLLCNMGFKIPSYTSATSGNSCHLSTPRTLFKTKLLQNSLQKGTSLNQNRSICHCDSHSCLAVWTVDVHQPKLFHNNNTKDGKECFRKDEFQLSLQF